MKALVYVAAFAPAQGEPVQLGLDPIRFPGSQLLPPVLQVKVVDDAHAIGDRNLDGYIAADTFHQVFPPDVSDATAATMLAHQRSIALSAMECYRSQPRRSPTTPTRQTWRLGWTTCSCHRTCSTGH